MINEFSTIAITKCKKIAKIKFLPEEHPGTVDVKARAFHTLSACMCYLVHTWTQKAIEIGVLGTPFCFLEPVKYLSSPVSSRSLVAVEFCKCHGAATSV
jgi:hypothetical protein